jgi:hypothetical protein
VFAVKAKVEVVAKVLPTIAKPIDCSGRVTRDSEKVGRGVHAATGWLHELPIRNHAIQLDGLSPSRGLASTPAEKAAKNESSCAALVRIVGRLGCLPRVLQLS